MSAVVVRIYAYTIQPADARRGCTPPLFSTYGELSLQKLLAAFMFKIFDLF